MNEDNTYFESYSDLQVHRTMLSDIPRIDAYKRAIFSNENYFKGKCVLDVGTGTGILSVLCAKVGAAKVYAVDASDVVKIAESIVEENNVHDIVEVVHGRVEDIELPEKVDVIVSEWMGFYLFHEGMLDSVLVARDKFLKEGGLIFPDRCKLFVAPCTLPSFYSQWDDVCGVKMNSFGLELRKLHNDRPEILEIPTTCLLSDEACVAEFSLEVLDIDQLNELKCNVFVVSKTSSECQGICIWFVVSFPNPEGDNDNQVSLNTSPKSPSTHWKQTVLVMKDEINLEEGEAFVGMLTLKRVTDNPRFYQIEFEILDAEEEDHPVPCRCHFTRCKIINSLLSQYDERDNAMNND